jgi:hypothetical protein
MSNDTVEHGATSHLTQMLDVNARKIYDAVLVLRYTNAGVGASRIEMIFGYDVYAALLRINQSFGVDIENQQTFAGVRFSVDLVNVRRLAINLDI